MTDRSSRTRVGIILAGGSGQRFWPLSRKDRPKQLLRLTHPSQTMLHEAVSRVAPIVSPSDCYVVTGEHLVGPIRQAGIGIPEQNVIAEPCKRNTSGALAYAAAFLLARYDDDVTMAVVTADHLIGDVHRFQATVEAALEAAENHGALATMGVVPSRPETGYGYIQVPEDMEPLEKLTGEVPVYRVSAFHEKPNRERAEDFMNSGRYFWNSGMFFWKVSSFLRELDDERSELAQAVRDMADAFKEKDEKRVRAIFQELEDISIDYALMEHAHNVVVARADFPWDDVGAWPALDRTYRRDSDGNVIEGGAVVIDSHDCIIYNEAASGTMAVSVIGAEDLVVVVTRDAVLVVPKDRAQDVRYAVEELKKRDAPQI